VTVGVLVSPWLTRSQQIYDYLNNHSKQGTGGKGKKSSKRVDVMQIWADDNPETKAKLFTEYLAKEGLKEDANIDFSVQRKIICDALCALPDDVKKDYEERANELRAERVKNKVLQGEERLE
jgi:hypothetical protein